MEPVKNIAQVFFLDLFSKVIFGVMSLALVRFMAPDQFGAYTLALSTTLVINQLLLSGFGYIYILDSRDEQMKKNLNSFLALQVLLLLLTSALFSPFFQLSLNLFAATVALSLGLCLVEFTRKVYQARLKFLPSSLLEAGRSILFASVIGVLLFIRGDHVSAGEIIWTQAVAAFAIVAVPLLKSLRTSFRPHWQTVLAMAKTAFLGKKRLLLVYTGIIAVLTQTEIFMLRSISSTEELATYGASFRYYAILSLALNSTNLVLLPTVQLIRTREQYAKLIRSHIRMVFIFVPLVVLAAGASPWLIPLLDKGKYPESILTFQILAASSIFSFLFCPFVNFLFRLEEFKYLAVAGLLAWVLDLGLDFSLIPRFGSSGAAVAAFCGLLFLNFGSYLRMRQVGSRLFRPESNLKTDDESRVAAKAI